MKSILFATIVLLMCTATAFGQKVKVDVDKTVNFSNFKTFGWEKGPVARNPYVSEMIIAAVENELTSRGLTKSADNADIKVGVMAATGADLQAIGPTWNNVNYATWGGYSNPAAIVTVTTGTLLIDLVETKNNKSVFRGVAKETLNNSATADAAADAKKVEKLIKKAVNKMFKQYPGSK
jgi:Domain of unknown function (DUF4136)